MKSRTFVEFFLIGILFVSISSFGLSFSGGTGSNDSPYEITNCDQLQNMSSNLSAYYKLTESLNCSSTRDWNSGKGFNSVGSFTGELNGQGYAIYDLYINRSSGEKLGLFSELRGTAKNLGLINVNIIGGTNVGSLAGRLDGGGIYKTYAEGVVKGDTNVGGLVGIAQDNSPEIKTSYVFVDTHGINLEDNNVGGMVGYLDNVAILSNVYSTGNVSEKGDTGGSDIGFAGGLIGYDFGGTIDDGYWDINSSNMSSGIGNSGSNEVIGLTTSEMKGESASDNMNFSFANNWSEVLSSDTDISLDGYPILKDLVEEIQINLQGIPFFEFVEQWTDTEVIEKTIPSYNLKLNLGSMVNSVDWELIFNNSVNGSGNYNHDQTTKNVTITDYIDLPSINSNSENVNFNFNYTVNWTESDGNYQTTEKSTNDSTQTLYKILLTDCEGTTTSEYTHNYTLKDESTDSPITGNIDYNYKIWHTAQPEFTRTYSFGEDSVSSTSTCIYPTWAEYRTDMIASYGKEGYNSKTYDAENKSLTNTSYSTTLYLSNATNLEKAYLTVLDSNGDGVKDAQIKVMKYYVADDQYKTISTLTTDDNGEIVTDLIVNDVYYKYIISNDGEVLKETEKQQFICKEIPCEKTFYIEDITEDYYSTKQQIKYNCNFENDTGYLKCTIVDDPGGLQKATMTVKKKEAIGWSEYDEVIADSSGVTMTSELVNHTSNEYSYKLTATLDNEEYFLTSGGIGAFTGELQDVGVMPAVLLILAVSAIGLTISAGATIILGSLGIIMAKLLGIISISDTALASIVFVGIILAYMVMDR